MIDRYSLEGMAHLWSAQNKFDTYLKVEKAIVQAWHALGIIDAQSCQKIQKVGFDLKRVYEIEQTTKHDLIAFINAVCENLGEEKRFFHYGITSSDCIDTALALILKESLEIILKDLQELLGVLKTRALEFKDTPIIGRSHGIHGEPMSFGLVWALWFEEMRRHVKSLEGVLEEIGVGMVSGAMGNMAHIPLELEEKTCAILGLKPALITNQVISRDRHAKVINALAVLASSCEKIAINVRHYQRTEVYEAEEYFSVGQKGSSAMPHKRNPVLSENITGLCRVIRGYATPMLESVALWHERDISHSSVERFVFPDIFSTTDFMLHRLSNLLKTLVVYPQNMRANLERTGGLVYSQKVLLELPRLGFSKEESYAIVQENAAKVWQDLQEDKHHKEGFLNALLADPRLKKVNPAKLKACFDMAHYLQHTDQIFKRVFIE
ncbi:Adenylosuccinate lyase PurB [Helicobacter ailurogastricus]|uniref:adenylosuccinate lyase n=1 Tax=Helicobacter ailurogastricus TaxID=1578720 RepID=UPI00244D97E5|nr:adenylosuccinate lyase [Helicobacter ailurogastricus]GMB90226.1 Adenylosuccinate lyase PurB [Helicobacter ailurogastricus]